MTRALRVKAEADSIAQIEDLTATFESLASMRISQVKDQVLQANQFFSSLWYLYTQLRIDPKERLTAVQQPAATEKNAFLLVTSEGSLSGDIDQRIIARMLDEYQPDHVDIIAIGHHGVSLLSQQGITVTKEFPLPEIGQATAIRRIAATITNYQAATAYYQQYHSLFSQEVATIDLQQVVTSFSEQAEAAAPTVGATIDSSQYVFEPSVTEVVSFMESIMREVALSQIIMDSRLSQYASRFTAMHRAHQKAEDLHAEINLRYHRAKRAESDERLKELFAAVRRKRNE